MDRLLDNARTGPLYLRQPAIAEIVNDAIHYSAEHLRHYELHAYVVMPNHVHMLVTPLIDPVKLMQSLKSFTAKRANAVLNLSGPLWEEESYDRLVRDRDEFGRIRHYIENNPVSAGLVSNSAEFRWSSAGGAGRAAAELELRPTKR